MLDDSPKARQCRYTSIVPPAQLNNTTGGGQQ